MSSLTTLQYKHHSIQDSQSMLDTPAKIIPEKWGGRNPSFYNYDPSFLDDLSTKFKVFTGSPEEVKIFNDVIYMPEYSCLYSSDGLRINYSCLYGGKNQTKLSPFMRTTDQTYPPEKIINKHEVIVGAIGSALHSLLFDISSQRNLVCFANQEKINTNYLIIDAIKSVNSIYISALQKDPNCFKTRSKQNRLLDLDIAISGLQKFGLI